MKTEDAVAHGIKATASTVTSAAIVMVAVFGIFATLSFIDFKQMGVGLAVAILIDATHRARRAAARDDEAAGQVELVPAAQAALAARVPPRAQAGRGARPGLEHGQAQVVRRAPRALARGALLVFA